MTNNRDSDDPFADIRSARDKSTQPTDDRPVKKSDPWTEQESKSVVSNQNSEKLSQHKSGMESEVSPMSDEIKPETTDSKNAAVSDSQEKFERDVINRLAFAAVNEQRRTRRWGIFFKFAMLLYALGILYLYIPTEGADITSGDHTALVEITGPIADNAFANANTVIGGLRAAYKNKNAKGIILRVNSPGGSPVQAGYINDEIYRLKEKHPDVPLHVVITDICASAAYYIAVAADDIYANKASIVGSIGVLMDGYGFVDTIKKIGVERRLMTAGEHKGFLDPFSPVQPDDQAHMQGLLNNIHDQFIAVVKKGRGDRLLNHPKMFSGLVWSGEKSVDLGLIDGLGSVGYVAREVIGQEKIIDYTPRPNYLDRFAEKIGVSASMAFKSMFDQVSLK